AVGHVEGELVRVHVHDPVTGAAGQGQGQVGVHVDQAGGDVGAAEVDQGHVRQVRGGGEDLPPGADAGDAVALDENAGVLDGARPFGGPAVGHGAAGDHDRLPRLAARSCGRVFGVRTRRVGVVHRISFSVGRGGAAEP